MPLSVKEGGCTHCFLGKMTPSDEKVEQHGSHPMEKSLSHLCMPTGGRRVDDKDAEMPTEVYRGPERISNA